MDGKRSVPIELLDVAGLVPGAHEGKGLGNKFLDDLRHADALVHVVDVSGTTDAEGKATRGYDPSQDIVWLRSEIVRWIEGNLLDKWHVYSAMKSVLQESNRYQGLDQAASCCHKYALTMKESIYQIDISKRPTLSKPFKISSVATALLRLLWRAPLTD